eukprot:3079298-Rhodomonas_salina.1
MPCSLPPALAALTPVVGARSSSTQSRSECRVRVRCSVTPSKPRFSTPGLPPHPHDSEYRSPSRGYEASSLSGASR